MSTFHVSLWTQKNKGLTLRSYLGTTLKSGVTKDKSKRYGNEGQVKEVQQELITEVENIGLVGS